MKPRDLTTTITRAGKLARIARQARLSRSNDPTIRQAARRTLASLFADARGLPMKVGQFMADFGGEDEWSQLTRSADPLPLDELLPDIEAELGRPWRDVFSQIDPHGIAASLGQVHRATLHSGEAVAVKVRYPDIVDAVNAEMRILGLMPGMGPARKWGFDVGGYKQTLAVNMQRELDYRGEAARQTAMAAQLADRSLVIPRVHADLSTAALLVQDWHDGVRIEEAARWTEGKRRDIARILLRTLFRSIFIARQVHGDPHAGNLLITQTTGRAQVVLLDFGCTVDIAAPTAKALLKLIAAVRHDDDADALACFVAIGFDADKLQPIADVLPAMSRLMLEPFVGDLNFSTRQWRLSSRMDFLLGDAKWWFRAAAPSNLLMLMRAFNGLVRQLELLNIALPWWEVLHEAIDSDMIRAARDMTLPMPRTSRQITSFQQTAKFLHVVITQAGRDVVRVAMPAGQVLSLGEIIPDDVQAKLRAANIDIDAIARDACRRGIAPGPLFSLNDQGRVYDVFLR